MGIKKLHYCTVYDVALTGNQMRKKIATLLLLFFMMISLSGGCLIAVTIDTLCCASEYKKDVSDDSNRNSLVGKEFILQKDATLFQYSDGIELHLSHRIQDEKISYGNGIFKSILEDRRTIPFHKTVKSGTKLKISQVLVGASYLGGELCTRYVRVEFIDLEGKLVTANASNLFDNTCALSTEPWNLVPIPDLLVAVKTDVPKDTLVNIDPF